MVTEVRIVVAFNVAGGHDWKESSKKFFWTDVNAVYLDMGDEYTGVPTVNICALFYSM